MVFFVNSRNGDTNIVQVEDQPEDTLIWAGSEKLNSFSQWLARQVFITQAINPAHGVELVEKC